MSLKRLYTLIFIRSESEILLGLKKRGFGEGRWNGFGGKVEKNETIVAAAARELREECGIVVTTENIRNVGHLEFTFEGDPVTMEVRVFTSNIFVGNPVETEEMKPKWFKLAAVPFAEMWPDDKLWFPFLLSNKLFFGKFWFRGHNEITKYELKEIQSIEQASLQNIDI